MGRLKTPAFIRPFLLLDVTLDLLFVQAHAGHVVTPCPEAFPSEVAFFTSQPRYMNGAFALDEPNHRSHSMFGWNRNAHMHVIGGRMPFNDLALFLPCEVTKNRSEFLPQVPKQLLASSFGHKDNVVFAIPLRVGQALSVLCHKVLLWIGPIKPPGENLLPERSKLFKSHW